jgi:hypothetical protein
MRKLLQTSPPYGSHQWLDRVNLEMCRAIAKKIRRRPGLMRIPRANLRHWKKRYGRLPPAHREWELILAQNPIDRVLEILTQDNEEGQRLRQSDPFAGILSEQERLAFFKLNEKIAA